MPWSISEPGSALDQETEGLGPSPDSALKEPSDFGQASFLSLVNQHK